MHDLTPSVCAQVKHYQWEYGTREKWVQDSYGSASAQMMYFARLLRERYDSPSTYRFFTDRRWDSMPAVVLARQQYNVSFTCTVKKSSRYQIINHWTKRGPNNPAAIVKSKKRDRRGKYRSATTLVEGVTLNTCVWNDSSLVGGVSADLGTENEPVKRRMGRHKHPISCPRMMKVRGEKLRGVDVHDQLRSSKYKLQFVCKRRAWPCLNFGLIDLLIVNVYIVKHHVDKSVTQLRVRWDLVNGLVSKADDLQAHDEATPTPEVSARRSRRQRGLGAQAPDRRTPTATVPRFKGADVHHHDRVHEYVTREQAAINEKIVAEDPSVREHKRQARQRDAHRVDKNRVRNPLFTSAAVCLVCKYVHGRRRETLKYCRECDVAAFKHWPKTNRATGFAKAFHPRLCSSECFQYFHTHNIIGLDHGQKRKRKKNSKNTQNSENVQRARTSDASEIQSSETPEGGSEGVPTPITSTEPNTVNYNV